MAKGLLFASFDYSPAQEDEFNDWYDMEHVPERMRVPGFLNAQRWVGDDNPKFAVATYDLESHAVMASPPYQAIGGANQRRGFRERARVREIAAPGAGELDARDAVVGRHDGEEMRLRPKLLGQFRALDQRPAPFARGVITQEDVAVARHALTYVTPPPYGSVRRPLSVA